MADSTQTYASHRQYVPGYHYVTFTLAIVLLVWAIMRLVQHPGVDTAMMVVLIVSLVLVGFYGRSFALRVQDRVIRMEEQMRMARLLSVAMQPRIGEFSIRQLVALRFASDAELPELAARVLNERIDNSDAIKKLIRNWRADTDRA